MPIDSTLVTAVIAVLVLMVLAKIHVYVVRNYVLPRMGTEAAAKTDEKGEERVENRK